MPDKPENIEPHESLIKETHDPLICFLNKVVVFAVKLLAILTVFVILLSLVDVIVHLYEAFMRPPIYAFSVENLLTTLGYFLAMLIAIEIFMNIVFYLKRDAINTPLVLATALTAVARKVILLDYSIDPLYIFATASVIFAVGLTYWLITRKSE